MIANVAGARVATALATAVAGAGGAPHWVVGQAEQCGVRSSYAEPAKLGGDRWAALIAARHLHAGASVVVNAGTTMTVDALSAEGIFLGGSAELLVEQALANGVAIIWSFGVTFLLMLVLKATIGVRVSESEEAQGLDLAEHGETAYHSDSFGSSSLTSETMSASERTTVSH